VAFERVALPALQLPPRRALMLIDELGKMELASERFREEVARLFETELDIVATVHVFRHSFTDELKRRADVERISLTRSNRDVLPEEIAARVPR
jgi:nucleoside-triphosphatase